MRFARAARANPSLVSTPCHFLRELAHHSRRASQSGADFEHDLAARQPQRFAL